ncbi:MAG: biotin transporter BioY [Thermodesulfobacteriota bacterium]
MKSQPLSIRGMVYASLFGALTAVGALISIPLQPVPITLHTLFMNLGAGLLGGFLGALSQVVYILLGIIGLPVFAGGKAGFGVLMGPTGGYLIGFVIAAALIGRMVRVRERPGFFWLLFSMAVGHLVVYGCGVLQLAQVAKLDLVKALAVGVLPFLPGDILKMAAAAYITLKLRDKIKA